MLGGHFAECAKECPARRYVSEARPGRLEDGGGNVVTARQRGFDGFDVVGGDNDYFLYDRARDALRLVDFRRGVVERNVVMPAVEVIPEAKELCLARMGSRQPKRHVSGLGTRGDQANLLRTRNHLFDEFGPLKFQFVLSAVVRAPRHLTDHRLDNGGVGMAQNQRAVTTVIVNILVAVDVPFP